MNWWGIAMAIVAGIARRLQSSARSNLMLCYTKHKRIRSQDDRRQAHGTACALR